jgi:hypothetical protein
MVKEGRTEKTVHVLFLRDGTESIFQEIYNWFYADKQRVAAKELLCQVIANQRRHAETDAQRERMLIRIKRMEKIAPDENLKKVLCDLDEHDKQTTKIKNIALALDEEHAEAVRALNNGWKSYTDCKSKSFEIASALDEANDHWNRHITQHFARFLSYVIRKPPKLPAENIDYGLVEEFCKKWLLSKTDGTGAASFPELIGLTKAQVPAVEAAVQKINAVLERSGEDIKTPSEVGMPTNASAYGNAAETADSIKTAVGIEEENGIIHVIGRRKTSTNETSYSCISYVIQGVFMLLGFKNFRTALPVFASANPVCVLAQPGAMKRLGAKGKQRIKTIENAIPAPKAVDSKKPEVRPLEIKLAASLKDISLDYQAELDMRDSGTGTCMLVRNSNSPVSTSKHFMDFLKTLESLQKRSEGKCTRVDCQGKEVILAEYQVGPLNSCLTDNQICYLEEVYCYAVLRAVSEGKPILLTDLFGYEELTVKRCVHAILAPVRDAIAAGKGPAVHIRVTCKKLHDEIKAGLESSLRSLMPLDARPLVEIKQTIDEIDVALPGMMMITRETKNFCNRRLHNIFFDLYRIYEEKPINKIRMRSVLSNKKVTHLYFFAERLDLDKNGAPQVKKILKEYAEFFKAARTKKCLYVTIELLWVPEKTQDKDNEPLLENLCGVIKSANKDEPGLKVCIVTTSSAAGGHIFKQFS